MAIDDQQTARDDLKEEAGAPVQQKKVPSRKRNITVFVVVTLLNIGLLALLWSQLITPRQQASQTTNGSSANPLVGHTAPDFTLPVLSRDRVPPLHLSDFKGKPVVLNFWASWCPPCKEEAPMLQQMWQQQQSKGVAFLGVDYNDTSTDALIFTHQKNITYPSVMDSDGSTGINYGVTQLPETFFINRQGVIVVWENREITAQDFQQDLQKIL